MIIAKNYIETGFSADDANKLDAVISPMLRNQEKVIIDFQDITIFTTLFFNTALSKYVMEKGPDEYERLFELNNLSEIGQVTYQHSLDNAKEYYNLTAEQRQKQDTILSDPE